MNLEFPDDLSRMLVGYDETQISRMAKRYSARHECVKKRRCVRSLPANTTETAWQAGGRPPRGRSSHDAMPSPRVAERRQRTSLKFIRSIFAGSRYAFCQRTAQCRCGPVTRPVAPLSPMRSPFAHVLSLMHIDAAQMHRDRVQPQPVVDDDAVALVIERPRQHHYAAVAGAHHACPSRARKSIPLCTLSSLPLKTRRVPKLSVGGASPARENLPDHSGSRRARRKHFLLELDFGLDARQLVRPAARQTSEPR